jgi:arabinofuranan 3-O-arabinosyltransferase
VISLAAMLAAGFIAASAVAPATVGSGTFGAPAQACALVALAAALMPRLAPAWATDRDGWRPSRPLPGLGRRAPLQAPARALRGGGPSLPAPAAPLRGDTPALPAPGPPGRDGNDGRDGRS